MSWFPASPSGAVGGGTAMRHRGSAPPKNGAVCSRMAVQNASPPLSPPIFSAAAPAAVDEPRAEHVIAQRASGRAPRPRYPGCDAPPEGRAGAEVRRLEREELPALGERGVQLGQQRAAARSHHQLGRLVADDARENARIENFAAQRIAVEVFRAAAAQPQRGAAARGIADALL